MMMKAAMALAAVLAAGCGAKEKEMDKLEIQTIKADEVKITVVYDNRVYTRGLQSDWGFSCIVEVPGKMILFDTGANGSILTDNMKNLGIDAERIERMVLSHRHWDHVGGLEEFLELNPDVSVYVLSSFPAEIKKAATDAGAKLVEVSSPAKICTGVYTTGPMGAMIAEQSLVIATDKGPMVITGCAHPGIVEIVRKAVEITGRSPLLVMGGFHLMSHSESQIEDIISEFRELGVKYAGPCHCTGDQAIELFSKEYGDHFVKVGAGRIINSDELTD